MSDLINRQQAIDVFEKQLDYLSMLNKKDNPTAESKWYGINWARNTIAELPIAEPKVGKWTNAGILTVHCSNCKSEFHELEARNYCPNCGAKMKGEK